MKKSYKCRVVDVNLELRTAVVLFGNDGRIDLHGLTDEQLGKLKRISGEGEADIELTFPDDERN